MIAGQSWRANLPSRLSFSYGRMGIEIRTEVVSPGRLLSCLGYEPTRSFDANRTRRKSCVIK
jgi:hypothetical protein